MFYLYTCFCHGFFLVKANFKSVSEVSKFRVNSLSIVYHCAIHNLPTLRLFKNNNFAPLHISSCSIRRTTLQHKLLALSIYFVLPTFFITFKSYQWPMVDDPHSSKSSGEK